MVERGNLAKVLEGYIQTKSLRSTKGAFGRKRVLSAFSEEVVVPQMIEMYNRIISNRR